LYGGEAIPHHTTHIRGKEERKKMVQSRQQKVDAEKEALEKQIEELKKQLEAKSAPQNKIEYTVDEDDEDQVIQIAGDTYVKVMSLIPYTLTLTTDEFGRGKKFNFTYFGEVKRILYADLVQIIEHHSNFLNEGYFIILNKQVVRRHALDDIYVNILTKEKIEAILKGNQSDAANLFKACSDAQRDSIVALITAKIVAGESIDLNLLDRMSRVVGYNIAERGMEMKQISELTEKK
jgi:uncharacterized FlaG/YvyC family protein